MLTTTRFFKDKHPWLVTYLTNDIPHGDSVELYPSSFAGMFSIYPTDINRLVIYDSKTNEDAILPSWLEIA